MTALFQVVLLKLCAEPPRLLFDVANAFQNVFASVVRGTTLTNYTALST